MPDIQWEIKMIIHMAKEAFIRKIPLLTSKLNIELRKKLAMCYNWSIVLHGSETWTHKNWNGSIWRAPICGAGGV